MTVYANSLEVACKAQANKVIAAFPDVCFTPPENPATPPGVPVPYPSFGFDSDTDKGTSTVKIGGKTITQKNKSYYTKTTGTEAGCAAKKGVITSKNTGKEYAVAWSSNVKADGEPVNRMTDLSTNNHASPQGNTLTFPKIATGNGVIYATKTCLIGSYDAIAAKCNAAGGEAHHVVPDKCFRTGSRANADVSSTRIANAPTLGEGVCVCLSPDDHERIHEADRRDIVTLGRPGLGKLKGVKLKAAKAALKKQGKLGVAPMKKITQASVKSLDDMKDLNANCIKKAKEAVEAQQSKFKAGQQGRTSNPLPGKEAKKTMKPPKPKP